MNDNELKLTHVVYAEISIVIISLFYIMNDNVSSYFF